MWHSTRCRSIDAELPAAPALSLPTHSLNGGCRPKMARLIADPQSPSPPLIATPKQQLSTTMFSHMLSSSMRRAVPVAMRVPRHMAPAPTSMPFLRTPLAFFSDSADLVTGTCKWFDSRKGFGFIVRGTC